MSGSGRKWTGRGGSAGRGKGKGGKGTHPDDAADKVAGVPFHAHWNKWYLRAYAASGGSFMMLGDESAVQHFTLAKLQQMLVPETTEIVARPALGVSTCVGGVESLLEMLALLPDAKTESERKALHKTGVDDVRRIAQQHGGKLTEALAALNRRESLEKPPTRKQLHIALELLHSMSKKGDDGDRLRRGLAKLADVGSRMYGGAMAGLQLMAALSKPRAWASRVPSPKKQPIHLRKWLSNGGDLELLAKAIAQLNDQELAKRKQKSRKGLQSSSDEDDAASSNSDGSDEGDAASSDSSGPPVTKKNVKKDMKVKSKDKKKKSTKKEEKKSKKDVPKSSDDSTNESEPSAKEDTSESAPDVRTKRSDAKAAGSDDSEAPKTKKTMKRDVLIRKKKDKSARTRAETNSDDSEETEAARDVVQRSKKKTKLQKPSRKTSKEVTKESSDGSDASEASEEPSAKRGKKKRSQQKRGDARVEKGKSGAPASTTPGDKSGEPLVLKDVEDNRAKRKVGKDEEDVLASEKKSKKDKKKTEPEVHDESPKDPKQHAKKSKQDAEVVEGKAGGEKPKKVKKKPAPEDGEETPKSPQKPKKIEEKPKDTSSDVVKADEEKVQEPDAAKEAKTSAEGKVGVVATTDTKTGGSVAMAPSPKEGDEPNEINRKDAK